MIYKSKNKYKNNLKSSKKKGGSKDKDRPMKDLFLIIKNYFKEKNIHLENDSMIKEYISKITNKQFDEMKIKKTEKQSLRKYNSKKNILIAQNIIYVNNILNDIEKKLNESEFIKNIDENMEKLLEELKQSKLSNDELSEHKLNLMKDVKRYQNMKKIEISKKKELDGIKQFFMKYYSFINYFTNLIPNLKDELVVRNQELDKMKNQLKEQEESKNVNKELVISYKNKELYIAQLEQDIKIFEKTTEFLNDFVNKKLEDGCICDKDDVDCEEWFESNKYKND